MNKKLLKKFRLSMLMVFTVGLLAACNTTDEYEENPDMGPPSVEEPAEETP